jgi:hypothetical protein
VSDNGSHRLQVAEEDATHLADELTACAAASRAHAAACITADGGAEQADSIGAALECAVFCDAVAALLVHQRPDGSPHLAPALELCARACEDAARHCSATPIEAPGDDLSRCSAVAEACRRAALSMVPRVAGGPS